MYTHTLNFGLGEDIEALRDMVRRFAQDRIAPIAAEIDRSNEFPAHLWAELGALGLLGITADPDFGGSGMGYLAHVVAVEEISPRLGLGRPLLRRPFQSLRQPDQPLGNAGAEGEYLPALCSRRKGRRARHVGIRLRLRRRLDAAERRKAQRPLRAQRHQDVDHQRPRRRHAGRLRQDRSGAQFARHHRLHRREGRCRAFRSRKSSTSSACAAPTPANWCSTMSRCRSKTCCTRKAAASRC